MVASRPDRNKKAHANAVGQGVKSCRATPWAAFAAGPRKQSRQFRQFFYGKALLVSTNAVGVKRMVL